MRTGIFLLVLALFGPWGTAWALESDRDRPVEVESDSVEFRDKTGTAIYRGRVRATQGSMVLTGREVTVTLRNGEIDKLVSVGDLATFHMLHDDGDAVDAESEYMEYDAAAQTLLLKRRARVVKGDDTITSERIVYNITTEIVDAGDKEGGGRVKMIIKPRSRTQGEVTTPSAPSP